MYIYLFVEIQHQQEEHAAKHTFPTKRISEEPQITDQMQWYTMLFCSLAYIAAVYILHILLGY